MFEVTDDNEDMITIEELNKVIKHAKKNRKSCGLDNLLWKFGGNELKMHILEQFNNTSITDKNQMSQEWEHV